MARLPRGVADWHDATAGSRRTSPGYGLAFEPMEIRPV